MMILDIDVCSDQILDDLGVFQRLLWKLAYWKSFINFGWRCILCYRCLFGISSLRIAPYGDSSIWSMSGSRFGGL